MIFCLHKIAFQSKKLNALT